MLVRHGETEWNAREIFRGRRDVELNETGVRQAECLGDYLADLKIDAIYSSPLKRAIDTAKSVAKHHGLDVMCTDGLVDFDYGKWEGLTHQETRDRYGPLHGQWLTEPHLARMPDGEGLDQVAERAMAVVDAAVQKHGGTVVLASHRVINKVLICAMLGLDNSRFWDIRQDLGGITTFDCEDGRFILVKHNDTCHLQHIQQRTLSDF